MYPLTFCISQVPQGTDFTWSTRSITYSSSRGAISTSFRITFSCSNMLRTSPAATSSGQNINSQAEEDMDGRAHTCACTHAHTWPTRGDDEVHLPGFFFFEIEVWPGGLLVSYRSKASPLRGISAEDSSPDHKQTKHCLSPSSCVQCGVANLHSQSKPWETTDQSNSEMNISVSYTQAYKQTTNTERPSGYFD